MAQTREPHNLEQVLEKLECVDTDNGRVSVAQILDVVGRRSFGPLLLVAGLITVAPVVGDIPGVPTMVGVLVSLVGVQLLIHRRHVWLPKWLLRRSAPEEKFEKALGKLRRPARFVDRFVKRRWEIFTEGPAVQFIFVVSLLITAATPLMELVPFSANIAGAALTAFGLSLIAHDGVLALLAFCFTAAAATIILFKLI